MTGRLALACVMALATTGCVVVVGSPLGLLGSGPKPLEELTVDGEGKAKVLLVDVSGIITDRPSRRAFGLLEEESTVARLEAELARAREDDRVRAVVVHVRSPGGGVTASDELYTLLRRFATEREVPIVAALGSLATSGGYYAALAADHVVAHPTTVTGSIGVIMVNLNLEGLLGKLGVRDASVKAGRYKDALSPFRRATADERALVQGVIDTMHARFVSLVRERRGGVDPGDLADLTDGRILDAPTALAGGLVDSIGDLHDAIGVAKVAAGLEEARIVRYRRPGENAETMHARAGGIEARMSLLELAAGAGSAPGPRFMYLWLPAADLTGLGGPR